MFNPKREYHLLLIQDKQGDRIVHLDSEQYILGRKGQGVIKLFDPAVSRHHATLTKIEDGNQKYIYKIRDGNEEGIPSTNGLYINGVRSSSKRLTSSDTIQIGNGVQLVYVVEKFTTNEFELYCMSGLHAFNQSQDNTSLQEQTLLTGTVVLNSV